MAVELTKVALWIETVDPGLPLGFFDANIRCGDLLLGIFDLKALEEGILDLAYKALTGDEKEEARYYMNANKAAKKGQGALGLLGGASALPVARPLSSELTGFRQLPENTLGQVQQKQTRFHSFRESQALKRLQDACDLYIAAFLLPKKAEAPANSTFRSVPTSEDVWGALDGEPHRVEMAKAVNISRSARSFHWPLEYPDVMAKGGFDVVLGNPPWEVMQLSEKEYFAARQPEISKLAGAERKKRIEELAETNTEAFTLYEVAKRSFDASNEFARASGRFSLTAKARSTPMPYLRNNLPG